MNNIIRPKKQVMLLYLLPSFVLFTFIVFVPILYAIYYSHFNWPGGRSLTYIGWDNFRTVLNDSNFWQAFRNNIYLTVVCIIGQLGLALLFASLLKSKAIKLKNLHRVVSYFPVTIAAVVVGFIWSMIYDYNYGLLNLMLGWFGLESLQKIWLSDSSTIMMVVSIPLVWQYIGMYLIIILAAMTSINSEVLEMAEIDGANKFQKEYYITFPLIKNTLIICIMLCIAGNMKVFDHIYTLTRGGPGYASYVMAMYAYATAFTEGRMGYGSAVSIMILIISFTIVTGSRAILTRLSSKRDF